MDRNTRKFILIDHTIRDVSGHYYEYAVHVLRAAQEAGYVPVLATNRQFRPNPEDPWRVYPAYKYGFWSAMGPSSRAAGGLQAAIVKGLFRLRCAFRFSTWGMAWAMRNRFAEFLIRQPIERSALKSVAILTPLVILLKVVRFLILLALLPVAVLVAMLRPLRHLLRLQGVRFYAHALLGDILGGLKFGGYLLAHRNDMRKWVRQFRCLRRFASDTTNLFNKVQLGDDDIVFVPTVSAIELMGLSLFFDRKQTPPGCSWHLLFRRDIYRGRAGEYSGQDPQLDGLRQNFLNFGRKIAQRNVFFHTDTDELSEQYNRLGAVNFVTLPIPHTHRPVERTEHGSLNVIYVGDARGEKGYQHIPAIVQDLLPDYIQSGKVHFSLQSNYNIPNGEPEAVIARSQLECLPGRAVELFTRPLSSQEYQRLLLSGDINLLLYDRNNYYARSSGILVESLSAAMPPVVPAGSWLSRQFLAETHRHLTSWRDRVPPVRTLRADDLRWRVKDHPARNPRVSGDLNITDLGVFSWLRVPGGTTWMQVEVVFRSGVGDVQILIEELDGEQQVIARQPARLLEADRDRRSLVLIPIDSATASLALGFAAAYPRAQGVLSEVRVDLFQCNESSRPPLGAVGLSYYRVEEVRLLLRDLIDHYPHYRETARRFAESWRQYHNSGHLIEELERVSGRSRAAEPLPEPVAVI